MKKNLFDAMCREFIQNFSGAKFTLVSIEERVKNEDNGGKKMGTRCFVEIPRGFGIYSRKRFAVTVWDTVPPVTQDILDDADFTVTFDNLAVTFIDSNRELYFGASSLKVTENGN